MREQIIVNFLGIVPMLCVGTPLVTLRVTKNSWVNNYLSLHNTAERRVMRSHAEHGNDKHGCNTLMFILALYFHRPVKFRTDDCLWDPARCAQRCRTALVFHQN